MSDSSIGQQGLGSTMCGMDAFWCLNLITCRICLFLSSSHGFCLTVNIVDEVLFFVYGCEIEAHAELSSSQDLSGGFSGFNREDLQNAQVNPVQ